MPNFLMLYFQDYQKGHEAIALGITLRAVFERMGRIKPKTIVIDKNETKLNTFTFGINNDLWCWAKNIIGGEQIQMQLLLCWFHV